MSIKRSASLYVRFSKKHGFQLGAGEPLSRKTLVFQKRWVVLGLGFRGGLGRVSFEPSKGADGLAFLAL